MTPELKIAILQFLGVLVASVVTVAKLVQLSRRDKHREAELKRQEIELRRLRAGALVAFRKVLDMERRTVRQRLVAVGASPALVEVKDLINDAREKIWKAQHGKKGEYRKEDVQELAAIVGDE